ncbi:MAG: winged helix-turn-helix domain-containing protein [Alphaproteobacteria bacterium]|nr:winged helix-turn-helix domain-containing protein [Alphaproteobacteria bacterium]
MQFQFAGHTLDTELRELRRGIEPIAVEPQVLDLLICLVKNRDRVVTKDDLIASVWGGRIISEATLTSRVYAARKALGDSGQGQRLIRTIARRGLRFVGNVHMLAARADCNLADEPSETRGSAPDRLPSPERPAIAVLPFDNMCSDPAQAHFADGLSEDVITALSKLRWFSVSARNSSFTYKGKAVHIKRIGAELGVNYVLEGSVRRLDDRVRITAQLNDVRTGSHIWAERYDRELADAFAVQDEITEAIVAAIEPQIYAAENFRAERKAPESLDAWDLVMRALSHFWRVTRADNRIAQELLQKAIAIDAGYGHALGLAATSHIFGVHMGWEDKSVAPVAERAAQLAIRADGDDAWAHHALGCAHLLARRFDDSLAEFETALRLNPNFSLAQCYYCVALAYSGRWREAEDAVGRALRFSPRDPLSALYYGAASYAQFVGRRYDKAVELARESLRLRADFTGAHRVLTAAAGMAGDADSAAAALGALQRAQPDVSVAWIASQMPIKLAPDMRHYLEGFRRAGLK